MDRMIEYMNKAYSQKYFFRYSTPSNYIDELVKLDHTWPTKRDDLFPYASSPSSYWTGYFSSRANAKAFVRAGSANLHASNQLYVNELLRKDVSNSTAEQIMSANSQMLDAMGIYLHHDAITGTARQDVADDYAYRLD